MSNCPDCTNAAEIWHWGGTRAGCHGCLVRSLARMPQHLRRDGYLTFHGQHQDRQRLDALRAEVLAEFDRIQSLKAGSTRKGTAA